MSTRRRHLSFLPVVNEGHFWLYIINHDTKIIEYYNTLPNTPAGTTQDAVLELYGTGGHAAPIASLLRRAQLLWPEKESPDVPEAGAELVSDALRWFFNVYVSPGYKFVRAVDRRVQENLIDCGVFVCAYAYHRAVSGLSQEAVAEGVRQSHMDAFRFLVFAAASRVPGMADQDM